MVTFVGAKTDADTGGTLFSSSTAPKALMPAGIQSGDVAIVSVCYFGTTTTVTIAGYTSQLDNTGTASDRRVVFTKALTGSETDVTATMSIATWGSLEVEVLRGLGSATPTNKVSQATSFASGGGNFTNPSLTINDPADATVYGYPATATGNGSANHPAFTASPASLSDWTNNTTSGTSAGATQGIGWGINVSAPGTATVNIPGPTTGSGLAWALDFPAGTITFPSPTTPPQPGGKAWRRKHRRIQALPSTPQITDLTVNAGLATGTGAASDFSTGLSVTLAVNAGLATGTGATGSPVITGAVNAGLASGTGTSQQPTVTLTVNAGLATGTGTAQSPLNSAKIAAGLATGTGGAQQPSINFTAGLATGTGAAGSPTTSLAVNAGLATGTGTSQSPVASIKVNAGLATGTGTAFGPTVPTASFAGLATGTGTALSPTVTLTVNAGLATGTGTAFAPGTSSRTIGLATGTGTSQPPTVSLTVTAGLATGTGAAFGPTAPRTAGLATGTGAAGSPVVTLAVNATLAHGTGTAQSPTTTLTVTAGLATGTGSAFTPTAPRTAGLATGTGTAFNVSLAARHNVDYTGSTLTNPNTLGGTVAIATLDGTLSVAANTLGGTASVNSNLLGGTVSVATLGGTLAVTSDTLTGTLSVATNTLSGTTVEDKMQEVDIILNEFNDATVTFQVLNNGSPDNITGMTVNALFKKTRGDLDSAGTTKTYSSGGGSPAITIVTPTTGSCTLAIPDADITSGTVWSFYRIDVVSGTVTTTAIFGTVTITLL